MKIVIIAVAVLLVAAGAMAQTYARGDTIPAGDIWFTQIQPDTLVAADQVILLDWTGAGASVIEAVADDETLIWLYRMSASRVVLHRFGPYRLYADHPPRTLVPAGTRYHAIEVADLSGEVLIHARGN